MGGKYLRKNREKASFEETESFGWKKNILMYLHDVTYMLVAVIFIFLLVFRMVVVSGSSMYSTLKDGDYLLLVNNLFYPHPQAGDVIVASKESFNEGESIVKRVIATEGQTVDIDFEAGIVYVDGQALDEPYTNTPTNLTEGMEFPLVVRENCIFAMGDNRNNSRDSRSPEIGQIDEREVLGRVLFLLLPSYDPAVGRQEFSRIGVVK